MKTPFGGDHFKLVNFDSARIKGSDVHPVFPNAKARLQPFVSPEIAETPLDARRKPELSCAADIWSLGVITFIMRSACLPMNRENNATPADPKAPKFDPEGIINSAQYGRIFDEDQRDFLIKCMQQDPLKRATAEELRKHKWIVKNELEVKRQHEDSKQVRLNFANQIKRNYQDLVMLSEFELDLLRALYHSQILEEKIDHINDLFDACDIEGGPDGKISFDEIIRAVDNMGVFVKTPAAGGAPLVEGQITLKELRKVLEKIDIVEDGHLD